VQIACVASSDEYHEENASTLAYATLAQRITNKPVVNEDVRSKALRELNAEKSLLKKELQMVRLHWRCVHSPRVVSCITSLFLAWRRHTLPS
jgi:hypothetical protein